MDIQFSPHQKTTIVAALTGISAGVLVLLALGLFWLLVRFVSIFSSVFLPLFVALILAMVTRPVFEAYREKLKLPPVAALAAIFLSFLIPATLFFWIFGALIVEQLTGLIQKIPQAADAIRGFANEQWPKLQDYSARYGLLEKVQDFFSGHAASLWNAAQNVLSSALSAGASAFQTVAAGLSWFVLPVYFGFFLLAPPFKELKLQKYMPFLKPETREDVSYLVNEFLSILVSFFRGQLIVASAQGLLFAIGFALVGLQYGFVIGLMLGFLNIIPYLGSMIGLAIALPLSFFQSDGGPITLALVILVYAIVQLVEGYYLTPKIMGDRTGLHPLTIIVALFFWGTAFDGIAGMILAIPLTAFLVVFWRLAKTRYITELV